MSYNSCILIGREPKFKQKCRQSSEKSVRFKNTVAVIIDFIHKGKPQSPKRIEIDTLPLLTINFNCYLVSIQKWETVRWHYCPQFDTPHANICIRDERRYFYNYCVHIVRAIHLGCWNIVVCSGWGNILKNV